MCETTKAIRKVMQSYGSRSIDIWNNVHRSGNRSVKCYAHDVLQDRIRYLLVDLKNVVLGHPGAKVYWRKPTRELGRYEPGTWGKGSIIVNLPRE